MEFNAAGSQLGVALDGETDLVFDVFSGNWYHSHEQTAGAVSPDGTAFVGGNGKHLIAWSTKDWSKVNDAPNVPDYVTQIAFPENNASLYVQNSPRFCPVFADLFVRSAR